MGMLGVAPSNKESNGRVKKRSHNKKKTVESDNIVRHKDSSIPAVGEPLPEVDFGLTTTTASTSKIIDIDPVQIELNPHLLIGYRLVDIEILYDVFNSLACPASYGVGLPLWFFPTFFAFLCLIV